MINEKEKKEMTKVFLDLVKIDSPSGNESAVRTYISKYLSSLGIHSKVDSHGNLIAKIPGSGKSFLLSSHMDTVSKGGGVKPIVKGDIIKSDGKNILGADDKAGIAEILSTARYILKNKVKTRPLELIFTRQEEIGSLGAKNLDYKKIESKEGFILDRGGDPAVIVVASPYVIDLQIKIEGKSAHSGYPDGGINALAIATKALAKIKLGRINSFTTVNFIIKKGGEIKNAVPAEVVLVGEVRSHLRSKAENLVEEIINKFKKETKKNNGRLFVEKNLICHGYLYNKNDKLIKETAQVWKTFRKSLSLEKAGSFSDANQFAERGLKVLTIGYGGRNPHSNEEWIKISDMQAVVNFLLRFLV